MGSTALATACDVQQRFMQLPAAAPGNLDYSARRRQAQELGGDCYDFVPLEDGRLVIGVGDASGKGLAAALMISNVQASLRTAALFNGTERRAPRGRSTATSTRHRSRIATPPCSTASSTERRAPRSGPLCEAAR